MRIEIWKPVFLGTGFPRNRFFDGFFSKTGFWGNRFLETGFQKKVWKPVSGKWNLKFAKVALQQISAPNFLGRNSRRGSAFCFSVSFLFESLPVSFPQSPYQNGAECAWPKSRQIQAADRTNMLIWAKVCTWKGLAEQVRNFGLGKTRQDARWVTKGADFRYYDALRAMYRPFSFRVTPPIGLNFFWSTWVA